jgi:hypothetical protein
MNPRALQKSVGQLGKHVGQPVTPKTAPVGGGVQALGLFVVGPKRPYGYPPTRPGRRTGVGITPALTGLFRAGRTVGVSQINAMATNIRRG